MGKIGQLQLKSDIIKNGKIIFKVIAIFFSLLIILSLSGATCDDKGGTIQDLLGFGDPTTKTTDIKSMRDSITTAIWNVVDWLTAVAAIIGTIYFMINGYFYLTALGDKEKIDKAKKGMLWSVIGIFILLVCEAVVYVVFKNVLGVKVDL